MIVKRTEGKDGDFAALVKMLDAELWERYPETMHLYTAGNLVDASVRVAVSYEGDMPVGCACLRPFAGEPEAVELKRMFVRKEYRGKGHSAAVLGELISWASEEGFKRIRLETGVRQPDAIRFYEKTGFARIPNYGSYADDPDSVCMERPTSPNPPRAKE
jgi:GNAT superfamily N-acetyltransferase